MKKVILYLPFYFCLNSLRAQTDEVFKNDNFLISLNKDSTGYSSLILLNLKNQKKDVIAEDLFYVQFEYAIDSMASNLIVFGHSIGGSGGDTYELGSELWIYSLVLTDSIKSRSISHRYVVNVFNKYDVRLNSSGYLDFSHKGQLLKSRRSCDMKSEELIEFLDKKGIEEEH